ncbi:Piezo-type mechanosensitive ion channel component 2 [Aphelenchoides fujianensis]|nr:Piezo-type mechanosensitive ion channel component 2 [Aphelenchoides fujianensis]
MEEKEKNWRRLLTSVTVKKKLRFIRAFLAIKAVEAFLKELRACWWTTYQVAWRILELHYFKLVLFLIAAMYFAQCYCAINFLLFILLTLAVCLPACQWIMSIVLFGYLLVAYVTQLVEVFSGTIYGIQAALPPNLDYEGSTAVWLGVGGSYDKEIREGNYSILCQHSFWDFAACPFSLFLIIVYWLIQRFQRRYRELHGIAKPPRGTIFAEAVDARIYDESVTNCFKVGMNYGFYKFGLEICLIFAIFTVYIRMDFLAVCLICWVFVFSLIGRRACRMLWPFFVTYMAVTVPLQYAMGLGLPRSFCFEYPWEQLIVSKDLTEVENKNRTNSFLYIMNLPNYHTVHYRGILLDFVLLILVCCQEYVFRVESRKHPAGPNYSIYRNGDYTLRRRNPHYDFIATQRSFVDYLKIVVFQYGHWVTILAAFTAGLSGTSLFALGYIVITLWILWQGSNLYTMRAYRRTLARWYLLAAYTTISILWKVSLQLIGCVFIKDLKTWDMKGKEWAGIKPGCALRQLFSIVCVIPQCASETKIGWDLIAFMFVIFQLRILNSYLFQWCILDVRCEIIQADRGAILINQLVEKQMKEQHQQQAQQINALKERMDKIRTRYEEQQLKEGNVWKPKTYAHAKLSGDYYMVDYDPRTEETLKSRRETYVPEVTPNRSAARLDPAQLAHAAVQHDMDLAGTLSAIRAAEQQTNHEEQAVEAVAHGRTPTPTGSRGSAAPSFTAQAPSDLLPEDSTQSEESAKHPILNALYAGFQFSKKLGTSALHYFSDFFNEHSREHRYVAYVLHREKAQLKSNAADILFNAAQKTQVLREEWRTSGLQLIESQADVGRVEADAQEHWEQRNVVVRFVLALMNFLASYTHVLCYLLACGAHALCGGVLTLPTPAAGLLLGNALLSAPSEEYTWVVIIVRFVFQFDLWNWNSLEGQVRRDPRPVTYLGIQKQSYWSLLDTLLLMSLFLHRSMLRRIGLWKDANTTETRVNESRRLDGSQASLATAVENTTRPQDAAAWETSSQRFSSFTRFYKNLRHPTIRYIRDLYPLMFLLDVICMGILVFAYSYFGDASTTSVITSSRIPLSFVGVLFFFVVLMVIDRALYLRKAVFLKLLYQLFTIVLLHGWIYGLNVHFTKRPAYQNVAASFFYMIKCMNLLISAWQVRNGYPQMCIGNLRTAVDWTWTDTCFPLFDFIKMETFFAKIYMVKCGRTLDENYPSPRGIPKGRLIKYGMGGAVVFGLIGLALVTLEGYPPLYTMTAQGSDIQRLTPAEVFDRARRAVAYLKSFYQSSEPDIHKVHFRPESNVFWPISEPALAALEWDLQNRGASEKNVTLQVQLKYVRPGSDPKDEPILHTNTWYVNADAEKFAGAINDTSQNLNVENALPYFIQVPQSGLLSDADTFFKPKLPVNEENNNLTFSTAAFQFLNISRAGKYLWTIGFKRAGSIQNISFDETTTAYEDSKANYIQMVMFVERLFPSWLSAIAKASILATYLAVVLLAARLIRAVVISDPTAVIVTEMPNPDYLLRVCQDLYIAREARDFELEEDIFAKLIFLFRSPESLVKWTRLKHKNE